MVPCSASLVIFKVHVRQHSDTYYSCADLLVRKWKAIISPGSSLVQFICWVEHILSKWDTGHEAFCLLTTHQCLPTDTPWCFYSSVMGTNSEDCLRLPHPLSLGDIVGEYKYNINAMTSEELRSVSLYHFHKNVACRSILSWSWIASSRNNHLVCMVR